MLSRRIVATRSLAKIVKPSITTRTLASTSRLAAESSTLDPEQNGNYNNPPPIKRILRDPYGKYWDEQERRNYGEPVHEDNDIMMVFSTEKYTWTNTRWGAVLFSGFVGGLLTLCAAVYATQPDKPAVAREFDLETELGGKEAMLPARE